MLHIGPRKYHFVFSQSGFRVFLDPNEYPHRRQIWRLDAHFVPDEEDVAPKIFANKEHWEFTVMPVDFLITTDWRNLAQGDYLDKEERFPAIFLPSIENLIPNYSVRNKEQEVTLDEFKMSKRNGYLFTCEIKGEIHPLKENPEAGTQGMFQLLEEIPLVGVTVSVPLNAADPVATARGIASREIGLKEVARTEVDLYEPNLNPQAWRARDGVHRVTLETPWRKVAGSSGL